MTLSLTDEVLVRIHAHAEETYPKECAGFLLGRVENEMKTVVYVMPLVNRWDLDEQHHRFILTYQDWQNGEIEADRKGLDLIGCFHSHPDHPAEPSEFDRDAAIPNFIYLISSVEKGKVEVSRAWLLKEDHFGFNEERIEFGAK